MVNALAVCSSPYLRQHAENPVAWVPWSTEAFAEARRRDVPVLVSIGYSTCHWCHVMAHESFEDEPTATAMNAAFVCIKVDREEHPEVDHIYMDAVQALTGHGGWPLNAFVDHAGRPFYACTYLPRGNWQRLVGHLAQVWHDDRARIVSAAAEITSHLQEAPGTAGDFPPAPAALLAGQLTRAWDAQDPGFAWNPQRAPKFPPNQFVQFAVGHQLPELRAMAEQILEAMQDGGIHDRVGGGFHRYSVDAAWRVPHFEKMLYDNAQLIPAYIRHERTDFQQTASNAGDYLLRDLQLPQAVGTAFAAAEDADDPDGEGSFYAWSPEQLRAVLGSADGDLLAQAWHVTPGERIMSHSGHPEPVPSHIPHPRAGAVGDRAAWERFLPVLRAARDARPRPGRDDKVLTDQNALALEAFAWLGRRTGEPRFIAACRALADFLATRLTPAGLLRTSERPAYITDYGALVCGFTAAFNLLGDPTLITRAAQVGEEAVARLRATDGGFFTTPEGRTDLIRRIQEHTDNAWPSGEAQLAVGFTRLWLITGVSRWRELAEGICRIAAETVARAPASSVTVIAAHELLANGRVAVVCGEAPELLTAVRHAADPYLLIVPMTTSRDQAWACLDGRRELHESQVLICTGNSCLAPARTLAELSARLAS